MERTGLVHLKPLEKKKYYKKNTLTFQKKLKTKNKFLIFSAETSTDKNYFAWMQSFLV